ncbi:sodium:proton antiporter [uncultured Oscillibacter sp.]|uniref:sodium:proton antiporter n=1 Tax=uncultured Oscillibacter sp. TaxID=876091 RepID=UPI0025D62895|nr:sodium:proton antiporter [uncultured Oscillibacter sp.]
MLEAVVQNRFAIASVILFGIGLLNMMIRQNLLKKVIGFSIMDSAVFLLLASLGYIEGHGAPIVGEGAADASLYINPIPSGLVLTGIVVSVSVTAFSLALIQRIYRHYGTIELDELLERAKKEED